MVRTFIFGVLFSISGLTSALANYTADQINEVAKISNSKILLLGTKNGCFVESHLREMLATGVEVSLDNCQHDVPTLIKLSKFGKINITTNSQLGCYVSEQLRDILSSGIEVTLKTCQYSLATLLELSKYGKLKLVADNGVSSWPVTDLMQMSRAGIDILFN